LETGPGRHLADALEQRLVLRSADELSVTKVHRGLWVRGVGMKNLESHLEGPEASGRGLVSRRLYRESALTVLAWPRAILLQLAHPLVAAGVGDHSNFRKDPWERFIHTFDAALFLVFGSEEQATAAIRRIDRVHSRVHGVLSEPVGRFPLGTPYDARDPQLLLWVYATTIESELVVGQHYLGGLSGLEEERYYSETKPSAIALGVPATLMPATLAELRSWSSQTLESEISIGRFQRDLASSVLYPSLRFVPRAALEPFAAVTLGLLPARVREEYGFRYGPFHRRVFEKSPRVVRRILPLLPARVRYLPLARAKRLGLNPNL
jgi:uncharacterized protein (DUF2236 family)